MQRLRARSLISGREIYAKEIKFAQMGVKYFIQVIKNYREQV